MILRTLQEQKKGEFAGDVSKLLIFKQSRSETHIFAVYGGAREHKIEG